MFNVLNLVESLLPAMRHRFHELGRAVNKLDEAKQKIADEMYPLGYAIDVLTKLKKYASTLSQDDVEHLNQLAAQAVLAAKVPPEPKPDDSRNGPPDDLVEILPEDA